MSRGDLGLGNNTKRVTVTLTMRWCNVVSCSPHDGIHRRAHHSDWGQQSTFWLILGRVISIGSVIKIQQYRHRLLTFLSRSVWSMLSWTRVVFLFISHPLSLNVSPVTMEQMSRYCRDLHTWPVSDAKSKRRFKKSIIWFFVRCYHWTGLGTGTSFLAAETQI